MVLDAARPGLDLQSQFRGWVIPADTVRAIVRTPDLVSGAAFRPSAATRLRHAAAEMPHAQNTLASAIADGTRPPDDPAVAALPNDAARAAVLGTAFELFRYRYLVDRGRRRRATPRARDSSRAQPGAVRGQRTRAVPTPRCGPTRATAATARSSAPACYNGKFYVEAGIGPPITTCSIRRLHRARRSLHDLVFPSRGAHPVEVSAALKVVYSSYLAAEQFKIGAVFTGLDNRLLPNQRNALTEEYIWHSHGGPGLAVAPWPHALAYGFAEAIVDWSPSLEEDHAIGPQGAVGLYAGPASDRWRAHLYGSVTGFVLGDTSQWYRGGLELRVTLTPQMALRGGISGNRDFDQNWVEGGLNWDVFF